MVDILRINRDASLGMEQVYLHPVVVLATVVLVDPHVLKGATQVVALGLWVTTRPLALAWTMFSKTAIKPVRRQTFSIFQTTQTMGICSPRGQ